MQRQVIKSEMLKVLVRGFAALAVGLLAGAAIPGSAQVPAPAPAAPVVSVPSPICPNHDNAVTWTFYAPNQTCDHHIKTNSLMNLTVVGGSSGMIDVQP